MCHPEAGSVCESLEHGSFLVFIVIAGIAIPREDDQSI